MFEKIGGRKTVIGMIIVALGVLIQFMHKDGLTSTMMQFLLGMAATYFLANVGSKVANRGQGDQSSENQEGHESEAINAISELAANMSNEITELKSAQPDFASLELKLNAIVNQNGAISQTMGQTAQGVGALLAYVNQSSKQG